MEKRKVFQFTKCRNQTSLIGNTIFHKTRTQLKKWFWAIYLVGSDKRGCSAKRLQKMIDVSYATTWLIIHKIRHTMKERDSFYISLKWMISILALPNPLKECKDRPINRK